MLLSDIQGKRNKAWRQRDRGLSSVVKEGSLVKEDGIVQDVVILM